MIIHIEVLCEEVEKGGWRHMEPTGEYAVMRSDGSKREVNRAELIALLKSDPPPRNAEACPKCGADGFPMQAEDGQPNRMCSAGCGEYIYIEPQPE